MIKLYTLKDKKVIEVDDTAAMSKQDFASRIVGKTQVTPEVLVSTVFLGIDHGMPYGSQPVLFETMVFGGPLDQSQECYCTYEQAECGHMVWVKAAMAHAIK